MPGIISSEKLLMTYPSYTYPVHTLFTGSSLGNRYTFAQLDAETNLKGLWGSLDNQFYVGEWNIDFMVDDVALQPTVINFFPESQSTILGSDTLKIEKQFFIPFDPNGTPEELQAGIYLLHCENRDSVKKEITIRHSITFPAVPSELFTKKPLDAQTKKKITISARDNHCIASTVGAPNEVRIFDSEKQWHQYEVIDNSLRVEYRFVLEANTSEVISFSVAFSPYGEEKVYDTSKHARNAEELLRQAILEYSKILNTSLIVSPDPIINRGIQWAKVNTVRVQHQYRCGFGFTNDPPQDIIVIRDLGWYLFGSNYLTPDFSRGLIEFTEWFAYHEGGKLTEYLHANETIPEKHDYKLNINDGTPLFVYGLYHYAVTQGNKSFLQYAYLMMKRACDWILSQRKDGLVYCYADGTNVRGICSWRNIIDDYNLTGAVTEINAECYFALARTADVAAALENSEDAKHYRLAAQQLKDAVNTQLVSSQTGMYVLNRSNDGVLHHDVTGDLIFPVMFDIAEGSVRTKILEKLTDDDMWTPHGSRTVSKYEKNYDPDFGYQLVGGVWPNLTAWTAFCVRREKPEKLVEAMQNIYALSEVERPVDYVNVVPGEFPERLHGETFQSRGMAMSPWMPPTYLWLAIEGLLGFQPNLDHAEINPAIPYSWKWLAVKNVPYAGSSFSLFVHDGILYSTIPVHSDLEVITGKSVEAFVDLPTATTITLNTGKETIVFVASTADSIVTVRVNEKDSVFIKTLSLKAGEAQLLSLSDFQKQIT